MTSAGIILPGAAFHLKNKYIHRQIKHLLTFTPYSHEKNTCIHLLLHFVLPAKPFSQRTGKHRTMENL
jgi:hypothetical protein